MPAPVPPDSPTPQGNTAANGDRGAESARLHQACLHGSPAQQQAAYRTLWGYLLPPVAYLLRNTPNADDLAADITQQALIRIHTRVQECHSPGAFRSWCRRIATNLALDELRRRKRLVQRSPEETGADRPAPSPEGTVLERIQAQELRTLLARSPMSQRSFRVVVGRFLDDRLDEELARQESELAGRSVLPAHIQVTRSKNLAKLRKWDGLHAFLA